MAELVETSQSASNLAIRILDSARQTPIVGIAVPTWLSEPMINVDDLRRRVADLADVVVIKTGDATWELSYRLPTGLDVYGSAVRVWWPGVEPESGRNDHPLIFVHDKSQSRDVIEQVRAIIANGQHREDGPEPGAEFGAVVTRITPTGAEFELSDGTPAFAHVSHLSRHDLPTQRVVRVGQSVRVQIGTHRRRKVRVNVTLLPFEPESWERLATGYPRGSILEGRVARVHNYGAFVELLPGALGLVHKSKISRDWVTDPGEHLGLGDRVYVKVLETAQFERVELSMVDVPEGIEPYPASIYPDGPPWLPEESNLPSDPQPRRVPDLAPMVRHMPTKTDLAEGGTADSDADDDLVAADLHAERSDVDQTSPAETPDAALAEAPATPVIGDEASRLETAIARAVDVHRESQRLLDEAAQRLIRMRGEAMQLRHTIEHDVSDVRRRVLELAEGGADDIVGSTQQALDFARKEVAELREQLDAAEQDRVQLLERLRGAESRAKDARADAEGARDEARRQRELADRLSDELERTVPEPARVRNAIRACWEQTTEPADREQYPWREPVIGPDFIESLSAVEGVGRDRVMRVCAEVVCGRALDTAGLEVHALRAADHGGADQRLRTSDGAKAYRASLQVNTPSARRLHYWELPKGGIELAKIVYHDDFTIR